MVRRFALCALTAALVISVAGCGSLSQQSSAAKELSSSAQAVPTSVAPGSIPVTHAPIPAPATATPVPTLTVSPMAKTPSGGKVEARIERIRGALDGSRVTDFPAGAFRGKNVIIVQVESLNAMLIGKSYGRHEITPNLNKLIGESWYWPNAYSETGMGNTVDAEFIVNTSLYAPKGQATAVKYANRVIPAMPRILRGLGYYTFTLHPNSVLYWNRDNLYQALGFSRYFDRAIFHGADTMGRFGSSDEQIFKRAKKILLKSQASGRPFYSHVITVSAHPPFDFVPESRRPLKTPKDLAGSLMGKYISAESYSDKAIGQFVADLKASTLWDNSILIVYGDHTAMPTNTLSGRDARGARKLLGRPYGPVDRQRIPLIIHVPGETTPTVRTEVAGQADILPTVADMVGADISQVPHMGRSLFVDSGSLVPLRAYLPSSFLDSTHLLDYADGKYLTYNVASGSRTNRPASINEAARRVDQLSSISDRWVMSLKTFKTGKKGWIPDAAARRAAAPYGFLQTGTG